MASSIDRLLYPTSLSDLREGMPPVQCIIWNGRNDYESIELENVYPFDTIHTIKQLIFEAMNNDSTFLPPYLFVGYRVKNDVYSDHAPTMEDEFIPLDYLWYPNGNEDPNQTYHLRHPLYTLTHPDIRFVESDGSYASPNREITGRNTIEDVMLKHHDGNIPTLYVFPLEMLLQQYKGQFPISEEVWNGCFSPYYPELPVGDPKRDHAKRIAFGKKIHTYLGLRTQSIERLSIMLEEQIEVPTIEVSGIRQLKLSAKKPIKGFEGSAPLFYRIRATLQRPYLRLIPGEGTAITKLHVKGVIPFPTLDDPHVLDSWGKETSISPGIDSCVIKYVHRPSVGITQPIYGTIHVFNDGTMDLLLQPPKNVKKFDPIDFRHFRSTVQTLFDDLPQSFDAFRLQETSVMLTIRPSSYAKKFNAQRLSQRLPFFYPFFTAISPLPNDNPILSLRYKAVSQYATENKVFAFITQWMTQKRIEDKTNLVSLAEGLQQEFQYTEAEAQKYILEWQQKDGQFSVQLPEDGEFMERFNPGIDLYVYANYPYYHVHVNRIDTYESYQRIITLLSLLFVDDDTYFDLSESNETLSTLSNEIEKDSLEREDKLATGKMDVRMAAKQPMMDDIFNKDDQQMAVASKPAPIKSTMTGEQKLVNPMSWFINKLKEIDKELFDFSTGKSGDNGYSRKCAGHDDRQPAVLSKDQYERMRTIYENDPIFWIVYPLEGDEDPVQPLGTEETITIMKYGSDGDKIHYYFCPEYYCLSDEIMIRPIDFESRVDRDGNQKEPNTCPFCHGSLITQTKKAELGRTVVQRTKSDQAATYPRYIDFMKKTSHPAGLALPCCFVKQSVLRIEDQQYSHIRDVLQQRNMEKVVDDEESVDDVQQLVYRSKESIEYGVLFESIHKEYIIESNKHPDPGIFAVVPAAFDEFFKQKSLDSIVTRVRIHLKLRPNAQGFLRIGTENTVNESLLGAIAPIIYRNSIDEVKQRIEEIMVPRVFMNAHFGNLVLEFFEPGDGNAMPATRQELQQWAQTHLQISLNTVNQYPVMRLYNSYHRFIRFIKDPSQRKDLRHIQPLLAEPGLFTTRGIQLVIMNDNGAEPVTVQCPTFGVSMNRHKRNDYVFMSRNMRTVGQVSYAHYELYIHTSNRPAKGGEVEIHEPIIRWDYQSRRIWPEVVQQRIDEYTNQCQSRYRSIYTFQDGIHPSKLIPLSLSLDAPSKPEGIIKDTYNHIVGVTFRSKPGSSLMVTLPVIDDGVVTISSAFSIQSIYLDWEDIRPAPVEDVIYYYRSILDQMFMLYPGYQIDHVVRRHQQIVAVQLKNGLYVPVSPPKKQDVFDALQMKMVDMNEFQWEIDKRISGWQDKDWNTIIDPQSFEKKCGSNTEMLHQSSSTELEEAYSQFRLIVSNWMTSDKAGGLIRKGIEDIIFSSILPEYERRKRMFILLSSTFLSWFYPDPKEWDRGIDSFLRKDCRVIQSADACTGSCYWKEDEGKCLLHVKDKMQLSEVSGEREVSVPMLFTQRVIDELVRFPGRRKQLMERGGVSTVAKITQPIHTGDQYIIPESSPSWTNLLRMDWANQELEKKHYVEEMTTSEKDTIVPPPEEDVPAEIDALLGANHPYKLKWIISPDASRPLMPLTALLGVTFEQLGLDASETTFGRDAMIQFVRHTSKPLGIIQLQNSSEETIQFAKPMGYFSSVMILVFLQGKYGLLMEEESNDSITMDNAPDALRSRWEAAGIVQAKKKPMTGREEPMPQQYNLPLVAKQAPEVAPVMKTMIRRPRVGIQPSQSQMPLAQPQVPLAHPVASVTPSVVKMKRPTVASVEQK